MRLPVDGLLQCQRFAYNPLTEHQVTARHVSAVRVVVAARGRPGGVLGVGERYHELTNLITVTPFGSFVRSICKSSSMSPSV